MSLLDTASLIVTPNGYKEGKLFSVIPSDGSGDMSVTRATTATRVNSAGLVELVPYNLLTYSEQFNINLPWQPYGGVTITPNNTTAPDGTLTADKFSVSGVYNTSITYSPNTNYSLSFYIKKDTATSFTITYVDTSGPFTGGSISYNFTTQAITITQSPNSSVSGISENLTNGWVRLVMTFTTNVAQNYNYIETGFVGGSGWIWGAQLVEGSTAKDYQKTETRLNIPRLDYSNGTCPSLLVEPQRTNRLIYSEELVIGKAFAYTSGTFSVTQNTTDTLDPFGNNNADKFTAVDQAANDSYTSTSGSGNITLSVFAKKGTSNTLVIYHDNVTIPGFFWAQFNIQTGVVLAINGAVVSTSVEDYGNGWFRCSVTGPDTNATGNIHNFTTYAGTSYLFGVQLEQGNYPTSYIPTTTSASVTRNADVISKTGISSLIGQTEGTLFCDVLTSSIELGDFQTFVSVYGNGNNRVVIGKEQGTSNLFYYVNSNGSVTFQIITRPLGSYKIALAYKNGDSCLYINGVSVFTTSNAVNFSTTLTDFYINQRPTGFEIGTLNMNSAALWTTRLTNDQLATLTTL
jgi:hypothetical protein